MKKIFMILLGLCLMTTSAIGKSCNGGTLIKAHEPTDEGCTSTTCNGHEFCKSDVRMNWWSAVTWCQSQGRKLAELSLMCPGTVNGYCANLKGVLAEGWVWSMTPIESSSYASYAVLLGDGTLRSPQHNHGDPPSALCE